MNYFDNPDYPTNVGSFAQHTYQGQQIYGNGFYYGGPGYGATDMGARRMDPGMPQQQPNPYGYPQQQPAGVPPQTQIPTGVGQMLSTPEAGVMPYASYPPNGPTQPIGFNQMMTDARRADAGNTPNGGNNPWATTPAPTVPPQQPYTQPVYQQPVNAGGYSNYSGYGYGYADASAMYKQPYASNPFEKQPGTNLWDNLYTAPQPYVSPAPNGGAWPQPGQNVQQNQPMVYNFPQQNQYPPMSAPQQPQQQPINWYAVSKDNWK